MRCVKKAGKDVGVDIGKKAGEVRIAVEVVVVGGEEAGKAGDEGCAPCMPAQALPLQWWSIWLWPGEISCCLKG